MQNLLITYLSLNSGLIYDVKKEKKSKLLCKSSMFAFTVIGILSLYQVLFSKLNSIPYNPDFREEKVGFNQTVPEMICSSIKAIYLIMAISFFSLLLFMLLVHIIYDYKQKTGLIDIYDHIIGWILLIHYVLLCILCFKIYIYKQIFYAIFVMSWIIIIIMMLYGYVNKKKLEKEYFTYLLFDKFNDQYKNDSELNKKQYNERKELVDQFIAKNIKNISPILITNINSAKKYGDIKTEQVFLSCGLTVIKKYVKENTIENSTKIFNNEIFKHMLLILQSSTILHLYYADDWVKKFCLTLSYLMFVLVLFL